MNVVVGRKYNHYKNGYTYKVIAIAREDDLGIDFVILQAMHDGRVWARSMQNFTSLKEDHVARFREVD